VTEVQTILERIRQAIALREGDDRQQARSLLNELWPLVEHGDAFARLFLAHTMADVQDDPHDELHWDLAAMTAYAEVTEARAEEQGIPGGRQGLLPSLHLNLAWDYEKLGLPDLAAHHLEAGRALLHILDDDEYGQAVRHHFTAWESNKGSVARQATPEQHD
jgi:hypothetical protein